MVYMLYSNFKISNVNKAIKNEQSSLVGLHAVKFSRSIASFLRRAYIQVHNCVVVQSMQTIMFYHVIMKNCRSSYQCTINCSHMQKLCHKKNLYKIIQFYQWTILNWHVLMTFRNSRTWSLSMWRRSRRRSSSSRTSGHWSTTPPICTSTPRASSCSPSQPPEEGQGEAWSELIWTWTFCLNMEGVHVVNMCL